MPSLAKKLLAEFAGTFCVVLISAGVILQARLTAAQYGLHVLTLSVRPLAASVIYGVTYGTAIATLERVSGGHFNPAVTVAHWTTRRFGTFKALLYIMAQLGGASAGAYALRYAALSASVPLVGPPNLAPGVTRGPALLAEAAGTFALVLALWATIVGRARPRYWLGGTVAGIVVAAASYLGAPYTGGVLNPARAFGPALAARQWAYQSVYWVGPLAGAVTAASLYDLLARLGRRHRDAALKGGATQGQPTPL